MVVTGNYCVDCGGNGQCAQCFGTGTNTHLNSDEPKCPNCKGTGVCPACDGSGRSVPVLDAGLTILDLG
jgi:hypothetical protein